MMIVMFGVRNGPRTQRGKCTGTGSQGLGAAMGGGYGGSGGGFNIQGPLHGQNAWVDGEHNNNYILVSEPYSHLNGLLTNTQFPQQHSILNPRHSFVTAVGLTTEKDNVKFDFAHAPEIIHPGEDTGSRMKNGETTNLSPKVKAQWDEPHRTLHLETPSLTMELEAEGKRSPHLGSLRISNVDQKANIRGLVGGAYRGSYIDDHGADAKNGGDVRRMLRKVDGRWKVLQPQGGGLIETLAPNGNIVLSKRGDTQAVNHYKTDDLFHIPQDNPFAVFRPDYRSYY